MTCEEQLLVKELRSGTCRCGEPKMAGRAFCKRCYFQLAPALRQRLYQRIGAGYVQAFETARQSLFGNLTKQDPLAVAREFDAATAMERVA